MDTALRGWLAALAPARPVAVVALGSFARREVCRASDIDLLLLHDGWGPRELEDLVRALCYPLWDAGLSVGHAVRTGKEAVRAAGERIDTATALTDRRLVAGDQGLLDDLGARTDRWLRRGGGAVLDQLAVADAERHARAGGSPGMLEPDLKDGAGGLRDVHSLRWAAACLLTEVGLDPLVGARYLGPADRRELAAAADTLLEARCALHLVAPGRGKGGVDRLRLDLQDDVAAALGTDADALLRSVGLAMRAVAHVHGRTWPLLLADARGGRRRRRAAPQRVADGVVQRDGLIDVEPDRSFRDEPGLGMRVVAAAARRGAHLGRETAERLRREAPLVGAAGWDEDARASFLQVLAAGRGALPVVADADHTGLLAALLPEWSTIRGRPQRNPFHLFDLDTHAWRTVAELDRVVTGAVDDRHRALFVALRHPDRLRLGALLHDVGKAWPGDHSVAGAEVADRWLRHMGFDEDIRRSVTALVRHHLLLPDVATRRDIDDEAELSAVAAAVGDAEVLDCLFLLSLADARATGPAASSSWKEALLSELHARVRRLLCAEEPVRPAATADELRAVLGPLAARYERTASTLVASEHARLLEPLPKAGELRARARPGPADATAIITIVAADRLGLMADCAGVLAGHGLTVREARLFTAEGATPDGRTALDWFVVEQPAAVDWDAVTDDLRRAGAGALDVAGLVAARGARWRARPRTTDGEVRVRIEMTPAGPRIEVKAPDEAGVLHRLALALSRHGVDVRGARVDTLGAQVRDVFFLRMAPEDPDALSESLVAAARRA